MPRLIDADKLLEYKFVRDVEFSPPTDIAYELWEQGWNDALDTVINEAPTVDAEPVRHGYWTNISISVTGNSSAECSLCGTVVHDTFADVNRINYCPNCGAKMDDVEEDDNKPKSI